LTAVLLKSWQLIPFLKINYTDEFKAELDEEYVDYQKEGEVISKEEMDKAIEKLLDEK
jgi:hypothetical protein